MGHDSFICDADQLLDDSNDFRGQSLCTGRLIVEDRLVGVDLVIRKDLLQCVAVCCSGLQWVAVRCSALQFVGED